MDLKMVIGVKNQNNNSERQKESTLLVYPSMWIPSTKRRHKDLLYYKTYLPCEEIERGNRERCENVKQELNTLENRKA